MVVESLYVYVLCKTIGRMLVSKGVYPLPLQILAVVGWIVGEGLGMVFYFAMVPARDDAAYLFRGYLLAVGAGVAVSGMVFLIGYLLPALPAEDPDRPAPPRPPRASYENRPR
jgi:hypothetical protein